MRFPRLLERLGLVAGLGTLACAPDDSAPPLAPPADRAQLSLTLTPQLVPPGPDQRAIPPEHIPAQITLTARLDGAGGLWLSGEGDWRLREGDPRRIRAEITWTDAGRLTLTGPPLELDLSSDWGGCTSVTLELRTLQLTFTDSDADGLGDTAQGSLAGALILQGEGPAWSGNQALSAQITGHLDQRPPSLLENRPGDTPMGSLSPVTLRFDEPIRPVGDVRILADGRSLPAEPLPARAPDGLSHELTLLPGQPLPWGSQARIELQVEDGAGNPASITAPLPPVWDLGAPIDALGPVASAGIARPDWMAVNLGDPGFVGGTLPFLATEPGGWRVELPVTPGQRLHLRAAHAGEAGDPAQRPLQIELSGEAHRSRQEITLTPPRIPLPQASELRDPRTDQPLTAISPTETLHLDTPEGASLLSISRAHPLPQCGAEREPLPGLTLLSLSPR